jgi:hypothetical protein
MTNGERRAVSRKDGEKFQMDGEGSLIGLLSSQTTLDQNVLPREKARLGAPRAGRAE